MTWLMLSWWPCWPLARSIPSQIIVNWHRFQHGHSLIIQSPYEDINKTVMPCTYNIHNIISTQFVLLCWVVITLESLVEPRGSPIFVAVASIAVGQSYPRELSSWGQHGAHLGPVGPRWAQCWPHEPCYQGMVTPVQLMLPWNIWVISIKC